MTDILITVGPNVAENVEETSGAGGLMNAFVCHHCHYCCYYLHISYASSHHVFCMFLHHCYRLDIPEVQKHCELKNFANKTIQK